MYENFVDYFHAAKVSGARIAANGCPFHLRIVQSKLSAKLIQVYSVAATQKKNIMITRDKKMQKISVSSDE